MMFPPVSFRLRVIEECESTNEALLRDRGADFHGSVLMALRQTAGQGRRGRAWWSGPGNLALSAGFRWERGAALAPLLPFTAGLALHETISRWLDGAHDLRLKWPNDLYLHGAKLAGMLMQARQQGDAVDLAVGIGVNLRAAPPPELAPVPATSLAEHADAPEPEVFAHAFLDVWKEHLRVPDFTTLKTRWEKAARLEGTRLGIVGEAEEVKAVALLSSGELLVETSAGGRRSLSSEEVSLRFV